MSHSLMGRQVVVAAGVALAAAFLLAGCTSAPDAPHVASAPPGAGAPSATASASPDDERPVIRPDTSFDENIRLWEVYYACERDHGIPTIVQGTILKPMDDGSAKYADARAACATKQPESYQDRLARTNPAEFQDKERVYVQCMEEGGLKAAPDPDNPGNFIFPDPQPVSIATQMQLDPQCALKAFSDK